MPDLVREHRHQIVVHVTEGLADREVVARGVDRDVRVSDAKWGDREPVWVGMTRRLVERAFSQEDDVGHHGRPLPLEGVGRQPDGPQEVGPFGEVLADGSVLLV